MQVINYLIKNFIMSLYIHIFLELNFRDQKLNKSPIMINNNSKENPILLNDYKINSSVQHNTSSKLYKSQIKPSIRIDIRELMKKDDSEGIENNSDKIENGNNFNNDHEKSNGNLIIESINANNSVKNVDLIIFNYLNKMKNNTNHAIEEDDRDKQSNEKEEDSLDNLIIKNQKELINSSIKNSSKIIRLRIANDDVIVDEEI